MYCNCCRRTESGLLAMNIVQNIYQSCACASGFHCFSDIPLSVCSNLTWPSPDKTQVSPFLPEKKCPRLTIVSTSTSSQKVRHRIPTTTVAWHSVPLVHCVPPECQESVATPGVAVSGEKLRGALHSCAPTPLPAPPSASLLPAPGP